MTQEIAIRLKSIDNPLGKRYRYAGGPNQGKEFVVVYPWDDDKSFYWARTDNGGQVRLSDDEMVIEVKGE